MIVHLIKLDGTVINHELQKPTDKWQQLPARIKLSENSNWFVGIGAPLVGGVVYYQEVENVT